MRYAMLFPILVCMVLGGCDEETGTDNSGANAIPVTIVIAVDSALFAPDATITVTLFDEIQSAILEERNKCAVSVDPVTNEETIKCPDGVDYQEVDPEVYDFDVANLSGNIEIKSGTVRTGEFFQLFVSGMSADNCNTTSASYQNIAESERITLNALTWATTEMACQ